ncbi:hypothetical protein STANM309S_06415 [Streptomyces tanashiensis]
MSGENHSVDRLKERWKIKSTGLRLCFYVFGTALFTSWGSGTGSVQQ